VSRTVYRAGLGTPSALSPRPAFIPKWISYTIQAPPVRWMQTPCAGFRSVSQAFRLIARLPRRVPGTRHLGPGTGSAPRAEYRAPKTEPGHRKTRTPGMQTPCAGFSKAGTGCGPRPWRDEGRGRCDSPTFSVQAEGRTSIPPILEASGTLPAPFAFPATDPHLVPRSTVETSDGSSNG